MLTLVRSVVECLAQVLQKSNDKVGRGELGQEELTATSANGPKRDTCWATSSRCQRQRQRQRKRACDGGGGRLAAGGLRRRACGGGLAAAGLRRRACAAGLAPPGLRRPAKFY